jgi:Ca2+-binding RTX toxin-like protein
VAAPGLQGRLVPPAEELAFVPAVRTAAEAPPVASSTRPAGIIEVALGGTVVRVPPGADAKLLAKVGGPDRLVGGPGPDVLLGGAGRDVILGNRGDDVMIGGPGADHLTGGSGRDRFLYTKLNERSDEIADFETGPGGDRLVVRDLVEGFVDGVSDPNDFVTLVDRPGATVVRVNADGQGADSVRFLTLLGVTGTTIDDLVADGNVALG